MTDGADGLEGYSVGSWWRSPVRAIHMRLGHGAPTVVPEGEARVSRSGAQRSALSGGEQQRVAIAAASGAQRSARSSGNRRARHLTRENVC